MQGGLMFIETMNKLLLHYTAFSFHRSICSMDNSVNVIFRDEQCL